MLCPICHGKGYVLKPEPDQCPACGGWGYRQPSCKVPKKTLQKRHHEHVRGNRTRLGVRHP
jgi:RecJ-like exonuclease